MGPNKKYKTFFWENESEKEKEVQLINNNYFLSTIILMGQKEMELKKYIFD